MTLLMTRLAILFQVSAFVICMLTVEAAPHNQEARRLFKRAAGVQSAGKTNVQGEIKKGGSKQDSIRPSPAQDEEEIVTIKEDLLDQNQRQSPVGESIGTVAEETVKPKKGGRRHNMTPQDNVIPDHKEKAETIALELDKELEKKNSQKYSNQNKSKVNKNDKPHKIQSSDTKNGKGSTTRSKRSVDIIPLTDNFDTDVIAEIADIGQDMQNTNNGPGYSIDNDANEESNVQLLDIDDFGNDETPKSLAVDALEMLEPVAVVHIDDDNDSDDDDDDDTNNGIAPDEVGDNANNFVQVYEEETVPEFRELNKREVIEDDDAQDSNVIDQLISELQSQQDLGEAVDGQPIIMVVDDGDDDDADDESDDRMAQLKMVNLDDLVDDSESDDDSSIQIIPVEIDVGDDDDFDGSPTIDKRGMDDRDDEIQIIPVQIIDDQGDQSEDVIDDSSIDFKQAPESEDENIQIIPVIIGDGEDLDNNVDDDSNNVNDQLNASIDKLLHRERRARLYGRLAYSNFYRNPGYSSFYDTLYNGKRYGKRSVSMADNNEEEVAEPIEIQVIPVELDVGDDDDDDDSDIESRIINLDDESDFDDDDVDGGVDSQPSDSSPIVVMEIPDEIAEQIVDRLGVRKRTKYNAREELQDRLERLVDQLKSN